MLPDYSAALDQYSQVWGLGTVHNLSNIMDPYGTHYGTTALNPSERFSRISGCLYSVVIVTPLTLWGELQRMRMHHRQETRFALMCPWCHTSMFLLATFFTTAGNSSEAVFPLAISWKQAANLNPPAEKTIANVSMWSEESRNALTPTILFMASSLSDSLLLSNISLRSSFLWINNTVTDTGCGQYEKKNKTTDGVGDQLLLDQRGWERFTSVASVAASQIKETSQGYTCSRKPDTWGRKPVKHQHCRLHFGQTCPVLPQQCSFPAVTPAQTGIIPVTVFPWTKQKVGIEPKVEFLRNWSSIDCHFVLNWNT